VKLTKSRSVRLSSALSQYIHYGQTDRSTHNNS